MKKMKKIMVDSQSEVLFYDLEIEERLELDGCDIECIYYDGEFYAIVTHDGLWHYCKVYAEV